ncbi:hypothetical protein ACH5RR_037265 [Cinchona calisaya]|uniref:Uncharacterized protein n=1 Tax=Cinchona calisaya TaxID=153742 RepID=A0ABD2Y719_9GENT
MKAKTREDVSCHIAFLANIFVVIVQGKLVLLVFVLLRSGTKLHLVGESNGIPSKNTMTEELENIMQSLSLSADEIVGDSEMQMMFGGQIHRGKTSQLRGSQELYNSGKEVEENTGSRKTATHIEVTREEVFQLGTFNNKGEQSCAETKNNEDEDFCLRNFKTETKVDVLAGKKNFNKRVKDSEMDIGVNDCLKSQRTMSNHVDGLTNEKGEVPYHHIYVELLQKNELAGDYLYRYQKFGKKLAPHV